jgi:glycosyltransferase involved in cell wall biosynthesis
VLLEAFARIARKAPAWQLDIVGDGPLRSQLQLQASALGVEAQTHFHGHVPDPFPLLYRASVFVLPSRFEGMPNSMLEAMACGLTVIVSNASPGPLELIRDEDTGLVFPVDDVDALAAAMCKVIEDALLRERLAEAAARVTASMALPVVAAHWEGLFREIGVELPPSRSAT